MNAKEWTNILINSSNDDELKENISKCFESLCNDVHTLVSSRHCKSKSATESCIKDVNQKWRAIVRAFNKYISENPVSFSKITLENMDFRNYFEDLNFVYSKHLNDNYNNSNNTQKLFFHKVTPFNELTIENLPNEILACLASLGSLAQSGLPITCGRPLAIRIHFLKYCYEKGSITEQDIAEFTANEELWLQNHQEL